MCWRGASPACSTPHSYAALVASGEMNEPLGNVGIASWMGAPMLLGERAYGVIIVQSYDASVVYGQAELDVLAFMASHVAVAIARMQADRAMRQAKETLEEQNAALNSALQALEGSAVGTGAPGKAGLAGPPGGRRGA